MLIEAGDKRADAFAPWSAGLHGCRPGAGGGWHAGVKRKDCLGVAQR
jgi:hypothetical protein